MAHIFLAAIDGPDGFSKTCVIKRMLPEFARSEDFSKMFVNEAKVAALLSHPNIVQVFEFGKIEEQYFIAMEWVRGASLERIIRRAHKANVPLGTRAAVHIGIPLAEALAYAHAMTLPDGTRLNLVHRDVTPGNVLISYTGEVKLTDFGVVKSAVNSDETVAGVVKGKYAYMSPEQVAGTLIDHRSDLFSLGIMLYELATGRRLFKHDSIAATVAAISFARIPPPSEVVPGFPLRLERILLKLLAKDPADRYQSANDLLVDLDRFRSSLSWTSGKRELAGLVNTLFPTSEVTRTQAAVSSVSVRSDIENQGSWPEATGTVSTIPTASATADDEVNVLPSLGRIDPTLEEDSYREAPPPPPWMVIGALAAAAFGSMFFWLIAG